MTSQAHRKKVLFHGSIHSENESELAVARDFCRTLAAEVFRAGFALVFGGGRELEFLMAAEVERLGRELNQPVEDRIVWYTCEPSAEERPKVGEVYELDSLYAYGGHGKLRTHLVRHADAAITVGGAKGVFDVVEKSWLAGIPFFPVPLAGGESKRLWDQYRLTELPFCAPAEFSRLANRNFTPEELSKFIVQLLQKHWFPGELRTFIVHGHDGALKYELKDFLMNELGLAEPLIIKDLASSGKTILEKFEEHAGVSNLVFVLLTPDDYASTVKAKSVKKTRGRQNVIFEYGYFLGKLGRTSGRVILLIQGEPELPSDIEGIGCIRLESTIRAAGEAIRTELAPLKLKPL